MRITQALRLFQYSFRRFKTSPSTVTLKCPNQPLRAIHNTRLGPLKNRKATYGFDLEDDWELTSSSNCLDLEVGWARDLVYLDKKNKLLVQIHDCASVQELFNLHEKNENQYNYYKHMLLSVLVLYDLKSIYVELNGGEDKSKGLTKVFLNQLNEHKTFHKLLQKIQENVKRFDVESLGLMLWHLNKLGMPIIDDLQMLLAQTLKKKLVKEEFSISAAARYLDVVFSDSSLRSYFMCQEIVPEVLRHIDACCSMKEMEDLTVALSKLHVFVRDEDLTAYKQMIEFDIGRIREDDFTLILKILSFLNYPKWREKNTFLMSKCIQLTKDHMSTMKVNQLLYLFEIISKIQGPGSILNELQRFSSKFLLELEDTTVISKHLDLLSSVIYFARSDVRNHVRNDLERYLKRCNSLEHLLKLGTILSTLKQIDPNLSKNYWDKVLKVLKTSNSRDLDLVKLCSHYITLDSDFHCRHEEFEMYLLKLLNDSCFEPNYMFFPAKLSAIVSFVLLYCNDGLLLEHLTSKLEENWTQLNRLDILKIASALKSFNKQPGRELKQNFAVRLGNLQEKVIRKELASEDIDLWKTNALIKCCVFSGNINSPTVRSLLSNYKRFSEFSTKDIENINFSFSSTHSFIPEVMEHLVNHVVKYNKDHLLGFSLAKILYLYYSAGYTPSCEEFYSDAVNIINRDQGRMTTLSLIQSALALCFFRRLPDSLIKTLFNPEFQERMDMEIANCYSKDTYPLRVRQNYMFLNRGVCLDYPESNLPWFHEELSKEQDVAKKHQKNFPRNVKNQLMEIAPYYKSLEENVITPYGYHINFVVSLDERGQNSPNSGHAHTRLAILLMQEYAYTQMTRQLRGSFQMQKRHLETLGYRVVMLNYIDWQKLYNDYERTSYLRELIRPKPRHLNNVKSGVS